MKKLLEPVGVTLIGLVTSLLTAIAVSTFAQATGINVFTFSIWLIVPVGAIGTGFVAASGYYFGSLYFHSKATRFLLIQMIVIAGLTNLLIYYLGYTTLVFDDGRRVADLLSFAEYLDVKLTTAEYRIRSASTGEVGAFGYLLALLQFAGFLVGGYTIFNTLVEKPVCETCDTYLRTLAKREHQFKDSEPAIAFWNGLFDHPLDGPEFVKMLQPEKMKQVELDTVQINTELRGCSTCKQQDVLQWVTIWNGKAWDAVPDMNRRLAVPEGMSLVSAFKK